MADTAPPTPPPGPIKFPATNAAGGPRPLVLTCRRRSMSKSPYEISETSVAARESIKAVVLSSSTQYQVVDVVVCLPLCKALEIMLVAALACGTRRLIKVLLPAPDGPSTSVMRPCSASFSLSKSSVWLRKPNGSTWQPKSR